MRLPVWITALLALAAWAVYIADRLLDAGTALRTAERINLRERHYFHQRHRRLLIPIAIAAACASACIVLTLMPPHARERNSLLGVAALAYFTGVHSPRKLSPRGLSRVSPFFRKELLVGFLFTAACALPVIGRAAAQGSRAMGALASVAIFYALLAWLNCHAIDRWESKSSTSGCRILSPACLLAAIGLLAAYALSITQPQPQPQPQPQSRPAALAVAGVASAVLLALLDRFRNRLTPLALRAAADLVLLAPLALLLR